MKRREFITLLGAATVGWPLAGRAQQLDRVPRIGVLSLTAESDTRVQGWLAAIRQRLPELGWADGSVRIDYRWGDGNIDRLGMVAKELVESRPDVIFAGSTPSVTAIARATRTIPIVFANVSDPVGSGLVESLARPGGNLTGFTNYEYTVGGKWVEILKELEPRLRRIAIVFNPVTAPNQGSQYLRSIESAARSLAIEPISMPINDIAELDSGLRSFARDSNAGLIVMSDAFAVINRKILISLAARYHLPAVYPFPIMAEDGGLAAYGSDSVDLYRRAAVYIDRILRGARPSELPIQQPTKFTLLINLKTAKALGLDVPPTLLARADEVIE
jgi:putative tryptophan/tyrosine transport system substrate-binding protein